MGKHYLLVSAEEEKERLQWEGKEGFKLA